MTFFAYKKQSHVREREKVLPTYERILNSLLPPPSTHAEPASINNVVPRPLSLVQ